MDENQVTVQQKVTAATFTSKRTCTGDQCWTSSVEDCKSKDLIEKAKKKKRRRALKR